MKRLLYTAVAVLILLAAAMATIATQRTGGEKDPVVSQSYLDNVFFTKVKDYIDGKTMQNTPKPEAQAFRLLQLKAGQSLLGGDGCELVARMGSGKVIASAKGGVCDLSSGADLKNGDAVPANHHLLVPLADGRGIAASTDMAVLVKGSYSVK